MHPFDPYHLFEKALQQWPARPALRIGTEDRTYGELHDRACAYASWIEREQVGAKRIAVFARKTFNAYAAILGILRSGRSYVPIHPDHPIERCAAMLRAAGVTAGICEEVDRSRLGPIDGVRWCSDPGSYHSSTVIPSGGEAYVMFTSGSTGGPKGVPVGREQVAAYLQHQLGTHRFTPDDRFTQFFALTFDLSVHDLFICWASGGILCVADEAGALRSAGFAREEKITVWFSVPSQVELLRRVRALKADSLPDLRLAFFCGEALSPGTAAAFRIAAPDAKIFNLYGPTETTIAVTAQEVELDHLQRARIPIGRIFPDHVAYVDHDGSIRSQGEGELLIGGPQVNGGYLNDPVATAKAFIEYNGVQLYRSGDLVNIDPGGTIDLIGRKDDQVKVMGHRIEPAEVDHVLGPAIAPARSITLAAEINGSRRLVTFIDHDMDPAQLFDLLRARLPHYMVPERIVPVAGFTYSTSGKLDRRALLERLGRTE